MRKWLTPNLACIVPGALWGRLTKLSAAADDRFAEGSRKRWITTRSALTGQIAIQSAAPLSCTGRRQPIIKPHRLKRSAPILVKEIHQRSDALQAAQAAIPHSGVFDNVLPPKLQG